MKTCEKRSIFAAGAILFAVLIAGLALKSPIHSILPYALAVLFVSICFGSSSGIVIAIVATTIAWISGAFPTVPENQGLELDEALITLTELVIVATVAAWIGNKRRSDKV